MQLNAFPSVTGRQSSAHLGAVYYGVEAVGKA